MGLGGGMHVRSSWIKTVRQLREKNAELVSPDPSTTIKELLGVTQVAPEDKAKGDEEKNGMVKSKSDENAKVPSGSKEQVPMGGKKSDQENSKRKSNCSTS